MRKTWVTVSVWICLAAISGLAVWRSYFLSVGNSPLGNPPIHEAMRDPLERDGEVKEIVRPSHWQARGRDQLDRDFEGYLVVDCSPQQFMRAGYFEWQSTLGGGRYHFEGTFETETRIVRWSGYCMDQRFGLPCLAHYQATLSLDG